MEYDIFLLCIIYLYYSNRESNIWKVRRCAVRKKGNTEKKGSKNALYKKGMF